MSDSATLKNDVEKIFSELPAEIHCMKPFIHRMILQRKKKQTGLIRTNLIGEEENYFSSHQGRVILEDILKRIKFPAQKLTIGSKFVTIELM